MKKSSGLVIQNVGYVTTVYKPIEKRIDITWVYINENSRNKGYAKEALQTLEGVYKAYKQHFPEAQNLFVSTSH